MGIVSTVAEAGITVVTIDFPPVNALAARGWFDLADTVLGAGRDPATHVVVLRAEGRGFYAGVDIKELHTAGHDALIGANRGCHAAFGAVYDCAVPVIVSLDSIPYDPWFRKAREAGRIEVSELDEGMLHCGLRAAGHRLPFLPIRAGLGSDVLRLNPELHTVRSPYDDEELVAMPALRLDAALVHLNRADRHGNAQYLGPDPYFDDLFCLAAERRFVSCERILDTAELTAAAPAQSLLLNRMMVDGVIEAPGGARFTSCVPDYGRDEALQRRYAQTESRSDFLDEWG